MSLSPDTTDLIARARADLRMGVPVVLTGTQDVLVLAAETLSHERLADLRALGGTPRLSVTNWRAQTLKARAYDGDLARITLPSDASLSWVQAVADPADDLNTPMKGPLVTARDGDAIGARAAIHLLKEARLLPAAVVLTLADGAAFAVSHHLTVAPQNAVLQTETAPLSPVISARVPLYVSDAGRLHIYRPEDGS